MTTKPPSDTKVSSSTKERSDELITNALKTLENPKTRKNLKLTVDSICKLTGLSTNTIRSRGWATKTLKRLKNKKNGKDAELPSQSAQINPVPEKTREELLEEQVGKLLAQNAILFEEILSLRDQVKKRDEALIKLQGGRLTAL